MESMPVVRNVTKEKIARGETIFSFSVRLVRGVEIASIAQTAGFESIYIDLEHSTFSIDTAGQICMACLALDVAPFVRVPGLDPHFIARVLDAGALGIIAPHIHSAEQARAVVRASKYPPVGARSLAGSLPQFRFRSWPAAAGAQALNDATMVIVMIESREGLDAAEEIAAVDGVDMLFIGTNDLTSTLGVPGELDHPLVREAYRRVANACATHGKALGVGGMSSRPDLMKHYIEQGARYVSVGTDMALLLGAAASKRQQLSVEG